MPITYNKEHKLFHIYTDNVSYVMHVNEHGDLLNYHYGKRIIELNPCNSNYEYNRLYCISANGEDEKYSYELLPLEYPFYGNSDYRTPAIQYVQSDGNYICRLLFDSYEITKGKKRPCGLPASYSLSDDKVSTLSIMLKDSYSDVQVALHYSVFDNYDVITKFVTVYNSGEQDVLLRRASSSCLDMPHCDFDVLHLHGNWANEKLVSREPLGKGCFSISSSRGMSSHQTNPFVAMLSKDATEKQGEVYAANFVYSGDFNISIQPSQQSTARMLVEMNPLTFAWKLESNTKFDTPETVLVYSNNGIGKMSRIFHRFFRERLCTGDYKLSKRPIIANNWETTGFNFTHEKIIEIAKNAARAGCTTFVLDDGWFADRNDDSSSLGDWYPNSTKLPHGIEGIAKEINEHGLNFGLWIEPEMVSPNSALYREHPDYCLGIPNVPKSLGRKQLVLDLSREEVCQYVINAIDKLLSSGMIHYVKWDMNRQLSEVGSANMNKETAFEFSHRYYLGLYRILETLTCKYKNILFEGCASGGGRFDAGMLHYMPQHWTSDNTDAADRIFIQYGTSLCYPISSIAAHVSDVPNHQTRRVTPLDFRKNVATSANLGFELDFSVLNEQQILQVREISNWYLLYQQDILYGNLYRLLTPYESGEIANAIVSEDGERCILWCFHLKAELGGKFKKIKLQGLDENSNYRDINTGDIYHATELMHVGITIQYSYLEASDFCSAVKVFEKE